MKNAYDINWYQAAKLAELSDPGRDELMYPEFVPMPTDAEIAAMEKEWPAWLFDNETNYPIA